MLTKRQLAEIIILQKSGGRPGDPRIDKRDVYFAVDACLSELIGAEAQAQIDRKGNYTVDSNWVKRFEDNPIQWDEKMGRCFVDLPASRISLERDKDIVAVYWPQGADHPFVMEAQNSERAWNVLEAGYVGENTWPFRPSDGQLVFRNMPKRYAGYPEKGTPPATVIVEMIPGIDGYSEDEYLLVPDNFQARLIKMVSDWFQTQQALPVKNTNDNNQNTH